MDDRRAATAGEAEPSLRLLLFDGPRLERDGDVLLTPLTGLRLLAYLAVQGSAARSTAAGALWPESSEEHALASLRTAMWRLRGAHRSLVETQHDRVRLSADVWVDSTCMDGLARRLLRDESVTREHDLEVVRATRGELLAGWYDDWALVPRERFRQLRLHLLEKGSEMLLQRGCYAAALDLALEVVAAEPLRESGHCAVIAVHLAEGNFAEALRQFSAFRRLACDELGVGPSPRMQAMMRPPPLVPAARRPAGSNAGWGQRPGYGLPHGGPSR